jgi:two-component system chemotaxis response regulator CheY
MRILCVDDDASILQLLTRFLTLNGYEVRVAIDAANGLAALEREAIDLVITDQAMPRTDGLSFIRQIRADARWKDLPIVMVTAFGTDGLHDKGLRVGAGMVLDKPLDMDKLLAIVKFALPGS